MGGPLGRRGTSRNSLTAPFPAGAGKSQTVLVLAAEAGLLDRRPDRAAGSDPRPSAHRPRCPGARQGTGVSGTTHGQPRLPGRAQPRQPQSRSREDRVSIASLQPPAPLNSTQAPSSLATPRKHQSAGFCGALGPQSSLIDRRPRPVPTGSTQSPSGFMAPGILTIVA